jgi:hypothetical protein
LAGTTIGYSEKHRFGPWKVDAVTKFLAKIVAWIVAGYPEGVPGPDRVPLLALLRRRLTDDEVKAVVAELVSRAEIREPADIDPVDIGVQITQVTDQLPSPDDVERVRARLATRGWPLDDPREAEEEQ